MELLQKTIKALFFPNNEADQKPETEKVEPLLKGAAANKFGNSMVDSVLTNLATVAKDKYQGMVELPEHNVTIIEGDLDRRIAAYLRDKLSKSPEAKIYFGNLTITEEGNTL